MKTWMPAELTRLFRLAVTALCALALSVAVRPTAASPADPQGPASFFMYLPMVMRQDPAWLIYLNGHRATANLPPLRHVEAWSQGAWQHSRYMVKENMISHFENSGSLWYTVEGETAGLNSNVLGAYDVNFTDEAAIDIWMTGPFHAIGLLDPALLQTGYGGYREADGDIQMGATLDVIRGLGALPPSISFPIMWPAAGQTVRLRAYSGFEYPDPRTHPGCGSAAGLPILLQIGDGSATSVTVTPSSFTLNGSPQACTFTESNYSNPDVTAENLGRAVLASRDAVVLIPQSPLSAGQTYTVSISVNGQPYNWSFSIAAGAP